ncbi:hypothetical protein TruAng_009149 [Truncatella angustata]|nr:hypothetical protein TruAng_009149 [Truncatella angustata]
MNLKRVQQALRDDASSEFARYLLVTNDPATRRDRKIALRPSISKARDDEDAPDRSGGHEEILPLNVPDLVPGVAKCPPPSDSHTQPICSPYRHMFGHLYRKATSYGLLCPGSLLRPVISETIYLTSDNAQRGRYSVVAKHIRAPKRTRIVSGGPLSQLVVHGLFPSYGSAII